ncbi:uncharacterized protein LOC127182927 [Labeo rohita]|uniref:uncharacterized protein LOC127182927 n=1 Tax=Labeo rohita TaxID=84645 RepID=UPI0021E2F1C4|nr:uncharacterized protein LOC127182927 [Labeo rohita]
MDDIISFKHNQTSGTLPLTNINLYSYGDKLKIPFFSSSFHSNKTLDESLKRLESTSGPLVIKDGKIITNKDVKLTSKFPCYILLWPKDGKSDLKFGQGFYYGSNFIMTAKHVIKDYNNFNIYALFFPTYTLLNMCLIFKCYNTLPNLYNRHFKNQDIAIIQLQGSSDLLQYMQLEIGELNENEELYFYKLECGCFVRQKCTILKSPHLYIREKMYDNEFVISKAGKEGDSGTPIFSSSGICVGLYFGVFTEKRSLNPVEYGRALKFDRNVFRNNCIINFFSSIPTLPIFPNVINNLSSLF